jgi:hypothetical protein
MRTLELIERKLGRRLDAQKRGSVDNLNEIPEWLLEDARALETPLLAEALFNYFTNPTCWPFLKIFVQEVVFGGVSSQTWHRGRILVPSLSLDEQLLWEPPKLLMPIGGTFQVRIVPKLQSWEAGVAWVGAPARPEPDANYSSPLPPEAVGLGTTEIESVTDVSVALRRWIAGRLAAVLKVSGRLNTFLELSELTVELPPIERWTNDARIAAQALLRECREFGAFEGGIPGFRGSDAWYREKP